MYCPFEHKHQYLSRKGLLEHIRLKHPYFQFDGVPGRPKKEYIEDMRDMYAGTAPYLFTKQKEEKRPVGRPRKRKHTGGRPKKIVK